MGNAFGRANRSLRPYLLKTELFNSLYLKLSLLRVLNSVNAGAIHVENPESCLDALFPWSLDPASPDSDKGLKMGPPSLLLLLVP